MLIVNSNSIRVNHKFTQIIIDMFKKRNIDKKVNLAKDVE